MHEINWSLYYIPKTNNEKVKHLTDEELMNIKKSKALVNKMNTGENCGDKNKENENNSNKNKKNWKFLKKI